SAGFYNMEYSLVFWGVLIFCLICLIQLFFLLLLRWRNCIGQTSDTGALRPVSVIICARNEVSNLQQFLPLVLNQDYPPDLFEVLLVDDQSTDGTAALLSQLQYQYPQLKVLHIDPNIQKDLPGKKYALREGIAAAKFDRLLLTDADCYPASVLWLQ